MALSLQWPSRALVVLLLVAWTFFSLTTAGKVFLEEPASVSVILGEPVSFKCRVKPELVQQVPVSDNKAIWYQIKSGSGSDAGTIRHMQEGRFFIVGSQANGVFDLYINYTRTSDVGTSYLCVFNETASRHAYLNLLPESWKPKCLSFPNTAIMVGNELEITCTSDGDKRTELIWQRNGALVDGMRTVLQDAVSLSYKEPVTNEESLTFSCSATLSGKHESEFCTIGPVQILGKPANSGAYIPYIIVGLLSVVVSMLFLTLLVVVFRHRQCRVCQREPPEPQTVLDMSQLQAGGPAPFFPIHSDTDEDDSDDGIGKSPPPDLIPTFIPDVTATMNKKKSKSKPPKRAQTAKPQRPRQQEQQISRNRPDTYVEPRNRGTQEQQPRNRSNPVVEPRNRAGNHDQQSRTRPGPNQDQQQKNRPNPNVEPRNRPSTQEQKSRTRPVPKDQQQRNRVARSQTQRDRPTKSQAGNAPAPLRRTSSNATLQENIDDRGEKDKTVTGKTKLSMTNIVTSSKNKKAATSQKQNARQSRQSKAKPPGTRKRTKQREEDAQSIKQLNVDNPTLSSGPRTEPGGTHAINDAGLSTNDISLDFEVASSSGQNKPNLNDLSENMTGPAVRQSPSLVGASGSNSTSASGANNDKVIYAELDFKKPVGLNILPDA